MVNDEFDNMDIHFMKLAIGQAKKAAKINKYLAIRIGVMNNCVQWNF